MSLQQSARLNGIDPNADIKDLFIQLPTQPASQTKPVRSLVVILLLTNQGLTTVNSLAELAK